MVNGDDENISENDGHSNRTFHNFIIFLKANYKKKIYTTFNAFGKFDTCF